MNKGELILAYLENRDFRSIKNTIKDMNFADIALLFDEISLEDIPLIFRVLPKDTASDVFVELDNEKKEYLIRSFTDEELKEVLDLMFVDDTVDIIEEMPANVAKRILKHTKSDTRKLVNEILKYPEDSAGSIMTTEFVSLRKDMDVYEAFLKIKATGVDKETIYTCYVTDNTKKLIGIVSTKDLLLSDMEEKIEDIMETNIIYVNTVDDREEVVKVFDKYDFLAVPVVDNERRLIGIVTVDDAIDVIVQEDTEDFQKMAAMAPNEDTYFKTSVFTHAKKRFGWLLFLMLSATFTQTIITHYEAAFATIPLLAAFIPMISDTGGNCGSQSATMIIRGMSLDEIRPRDILKVILKESEISLMVGIVLSVVNGIRIIITYHSFVLALVLGLTLMCTVFMSKLLGGILPMIAKQVHLDPAVMASPLITTIVDACSLIIYFNIAMHILKI
ncbi:MULTISPECIES: magnesium transporter [Anaerofustis]|uniref:magnesium transporter n=1 Tax=Anaerofustis TaxID=264995 RepID=UPI0011066882|nr:MULTISPECIES: magnesium transporter [Anaerofustis]MCO8193257.1 magnesium transporter [Anaerofustis sp. NSJ-163]